MFHSRKSSYIFVCSASFGRLMSVFFHIAGLTLVTMPCCRAVVLLCQANAWSWASKSEKLKRQRWFMRCSAEPHSRAAPYWTLTSLLTTRLAMVPSPLESQKTLVNIWFLFHSFCHSIFVFILIGRCVSLEWPTNFRSQEEVKKMERLHGLCLTHVLESSLIEDVQDDFSKALCIFNQSATHAQGDRRAKFISTTVQGLWFVQLLSYTAKSFS